MKYRIIKTTWASGGETFKPQVKTFFGWKTLYGVLAPFGAYLPFVTRDEAKERIDRHFRDRRGKRKKKVFEYITKPEISAVARVSPVDVTQAKKRIS